MMSKYVAILHAGEITVHLPHQTGDYATLCGEDGDDDAPCVDLMEVDVPKGRKVDCRICLNIWKVAILYKISDFDLKKIG